LPASADLRILHGAYFRLPNMPGHQWIHYGPYIEPRDAAQALRTTPGTVRQWSNAGLIRSTKIYCPSRSRRNALISVYNAYDVLRLHDLIAQHPRPTLRSSGACSVTLLRIGDQATADSGPDTHSADQQRP
jgi:hypothetical protein